MSEVRNGLRHFERAQVRVGKRIEVWFVPGSRGVAGVVRDIIRDEEGKLCVSIGFEGGKVRPERLSARIHARVAQAPQGGEGS